MLVISLQSSYKGHPQSTITSTNVHRSVLEDLKNKERTEETKISPLWKRTITRTRYRDCKTNE